MLAFSKDKKDPRSNQPPVSNVVSLTEISVDVVGGRSMFRVPVVAVFVVLMASASAFAQDNKEWCTDAHMKQMDDQVSKMTEAAKKKTAMNQLEKSKREMKKGDMKGCVKHMEKAHKAMGL
jgi:hypothetical protein